MAQIYAERSGSHPDQWLEMMRAETWFSAEEAVAAGIADLVVDARADRPKVLAQMNGKRFAFAGRSDAPKPKILEENMTFAKEVAKRLGLSADDLDESTVLAALDETLAEQADATEADAEELADGVENVEQPGPGEAQPEPGEHEEVSEEEAEEPGEIEQPAEEEGERPEETVTIDASTYAELKAAAEHGWAAAEEKANCLLYTSPSPRDS